MALPGVPSIAILGCGLCVDTMLTGWVPFVACWIPLLLLWTLIAGPICYAAAKRSAPLEVRSTFLLFLGFIAANIVGLPLLMGAVIAPVILVLPFWGVAIRNGIRQPNLIWRRANLVLLGLLVCAIPVSYLLPKPFSAYRQKLLGPEKAKAQRTHGRVAAQRFMRPEPIFIRNTEIARGDRLNQSPWCCASPKYILLNPRWPE